jgi:hypothetical protein
VRGDRDQRGVMSSGVEHRVVCCSRLRLQCMLCSVGGTPFTFTVCCQGALGAIYTSLYYVCAHPSVIP